MPWKSRGARVIRLIAPEGRLPIHSVAFSSSPSSSLTHYLGRQPNITIFNCQYQSLCYVFCYNPGLLKGMDFQLVAE